jgi:hypothetical protein
MSNLDLQLREALENWRSLKTEEVYGYSGLVDFGPTLVMPAEVVERVIHCSHHSKIMNVADLKKETRWDEADSWGMEVIDIITRIYPTNRLPPLTTTLPRAFSTMSSDLPLAPAKERQKSRCSACNAVGHNRKFVY